MIFKEVELTDKILSELIACSEAWEQENSCHGYRKNAEEDIKGNRIFLAREEEQMVGYLFGYMDKGERKNAIHEKDEPFFEVEELYVKPELRSRGIGKQLFQYMEEKMKEEKCVSLFSVYFINLCKEVTLKLVSFIIILELDQKLVSKGA